MSCSSGCMYFARVLKQHPAVTEAVVCHCPCLILEVARAPYLLLMLKAPSLLQPSILALSATLIVIKQSNTRCKLVRPRRVAGHMCVHATRRSCTAVRCQATSNQGIYVTVNRFNKGRRVHGRPGAGPQTRVTSVLTPHSLRWRAQPLEWHALNDSLLWQERYASRYALAQRALRLCSCASGVARCHHVRKQRACTVQPNLPPHV